MKPSDYLKRKQGIFLSDYDKIKFDKRFIDKKEIENSETYVKGYQEAREEFERLIDKYCESKCTYYIEKELKKELKQ